MATTATITVPEGWTYARTDQRVQAVSADGGATLVFGAAANSSKEAIRSLFYAILAELSVTGVVDQLVDLGKPQVTWPANSLEVHAWQIEKLKRGTTAQKEDPMMGGQPGALLLSVTQMGGEASAVVGVGFLFRSAPTTLAVPIKACMTSIRARGAAPAEGEAK
ncbi:MAG: hypothetical protein JW751_16510 [Polyangiaceae bacterium]|nr:hypothetical protein [Polyangiaceae bacterium]